MLEGPLMSDKLKPCPFCGSEDVELRDGCLFNGAVHCNTCSADVVFAAVKSLSQGGDSWKENCIAGWNRRAEVKGDADAD